VGILITLLKVAEKHTSEMGGIFRVFIGYALMEFRGGIFNVGDVGDA
jgi:hypothetical protein